MSVWDDVGDLAVVRVEQDVNVRMAQHSAEHGGVAVLRHALVGVGKVAVVAVCPDRHPRRDRGVEFRRVEAPLLAGVAAKEFLVQLATDLRHHHVLRGEDLLSGFGPLGEERLEFETRQVEAIERIHRVEVDRDRHQATVDERPHPVLVLPPPGEARQVAEHLVRVGVEDVRTVAVNQQSLMVILIVGVAADVIAAVDQQHAAVAFTGDPFGKNGAGVACPNDQIIESGRHLVRLYRSLSAVTDGEKVLPPPCASALHANRPSVCGPARVECVPDRSVHRGP